MRHAGTRQLPHGRRAEPGAKCGEEGTGTGGRTLMSSRSGMGGGECSCDSRRATQLSLSASDSACAWRALEMTGII